MLIVADENIPLLDEFWTSAKYAAAPVAPLMRLL